MLRRLSVQNFALIEQLEMTLSPGLNIITGETGAGKSILLGALGMLLGSKNEGTTLKDSSKNCVIEGEFEIANHALQSFFEENDLDYADVTIVRRIITPAGKSRAYINDLPVPLTQLREFGSRLIDIHSQHRNPILSSAEFRTDALDIYAGNKQTADRYATAYGRLCELRRQLARLQEEAAAARRDEEWLRFQAEELTAANLSEGELGPLETEQALLAHADRICEVLTTLRNRFDNDETGILAQLKTAEVELGRLSEHYAAAAELSARLHAVSEELKDIDTTLTDDSQRIESNPERLQKADERLGLLYSLCQKYRVADPDALIALRDQTVTRLTAIVRRDRELDELTREIDTQENEALRLAGELHRAREKAAPEFEKQIVTLLARLGMAEARFRIALEEQPALGRNGRDQVAFLFSANPGLAPQAVERIASGGEISRVMLAIKALLARCMQLPTIIFDEIDTGVSGRIADAMGEIIESLGRTMQVVNITHLPQVASKGDTHFVVYKDASRTRIAMLSATERITEIAKMLSGSTVSEAALTQARILLAANAPKI